MGILISLVWEKFEDNKGLIRSRTSKMQWLTKKGQTMIYKTLHRKLKIDQNEIH
jgi:hypothetical protein